jgi:hypothetical protein
MPHVLADQETHTTETGVESPEAISSRKVALFIKEPIGGKIHLPVDMADIPPLKIECRVEKTIIGRGFHQPDGNGDMA